MKGQITLPSLSAGMEDAVIARWLIKPGDSVTKGQALAEVETDKATMELEAEQDGTIGYIDIEAGKRASVGQVIARFAGADNAAHLAVEAPHLANKPDKLFASPIARRLAAAAGLSLEGVRGSGPRGRIIKIDIEALTTSATARVEPAPRAPVSASVIQPTAGPIAIPAGIGPYEAKPVSSMRRVIARRLAESKQSVPHFYLSADCDMAALLALRAQINADRDKTQKVSVNDLMIKASACALRLVPEANVIWHGEEILQLADVDIAVAVATDGGLITPIIRGADRLSLGAVSAEMKQLAARARDGKLKPDEFQGGGFSLSNLGMYGVKQFSAIINPPQSCILAVGATEQRPVGRDGQIVLTDVMTVTLSVDHRSVDGAVGAQLLAAFKAAVEKPMSLLL